MVEALIVGGVQRPARDGSTLTVREPATGNVLAEVASAGPADMAEAVEVAYRAFESGSWSRMPAVPARVAGLLREQADALANVEARNGEKALADALWEVEAAAGTFEYYAGAADKLFGEVIPAADPGLTVVLREPVGSSDSSWLGTSRCSSRAGRWHPRWRVGTRSCSSRPSSRRSPRSCSAGCWLRRESLTPAYSSSLASAPPPAMPWCQRRGWPRSRSRAPWRRPCPSFTRRRRTSHGSPSNSAVSQVALCLPMPTFLAVWPRPRCPCLATPDRIAALAVGCWWRGPCTTMSWPASQLGPRRCGSVGPSMPAWRWVR